MLAMADDGGLLLNLAGAEVPAPGSSAKQRDNWRSKSFKKHARADAVGVRSIPLPAGLHPRV
jgi:hypothetical protein